jgi:hypothetical protein
VSITGIAIKNEKNIPARNRIVIGTMNLISVLALVFLEIAGLINPKISLTIIGIVPVIPNKIDTVI